MRAEIIHGEGFAVLRDLPDDSVDCVITDPPYNSGGRTTTERTRATAMDKYVSGDARVVEEFSDFVGESRDQRGYQVWLTMVLAEALRTNLDEQASQGLVGQMLGLPVYVDALIPTNIGGGTNQDEIYLAKADDLWLWEGQVRAEAFQQTYANNLSVFVRLYNYASFQAGGSAARIGDRARYAA